MVALAYAAAFKGVEARLVEVQCSAAAGLPAFSIVGLPDKAVSEARERVRSASTKMAIALPPKRITVILSPADLPKEGSHFDLLLALSLLAALDILPREKVRDTVAPRALSLGAALVPVIGALPAAMAAALEEKTLLCLQASGPEAASVGATEVIRHYTGQAPLLPARPGEVMREPAAGDLRDVKGQERAKGALEIAGAGRHRLIMVGSSRSGKSMLARRLPTILPPLPAGEALEALMIHSLAGLLTEEVSRGFGLIKTAPHVLHGGPRRRRTGRESRPGLARAQRRPVPGRVPGVPESRAGDAAPAHRDRRGRRGTGPTPTCATRAGSCWWPTLTPAAAGTRRTRRTPAPRRPRAARTTSGASRACLGTASTCA